jgi:Icc-related predicted phosphoesterase
MNVLHLSDTHTWHKQLRLPKNIDMVIHTGDATNYRNPYQNESEMHEFLEWYSGINIKHKIFVAGNHDTSIEKGLVTHNQIRDMGITYLHNSMVTINGINIWGSPYTPNFGRWAFMKSRQKINAVWDTIPDNIDIVATHGPPKGILDLTINHQNVCTQCGDSALFKAFRRVKPAYALFGHIHNCKNVYNTGVLHINDLETIFSNASCCTDGKWGNITSHGNVLNIQI